MEISIREVRPGDEADLAFIQTESWKAAFADILDPETLTRCTNIEKATAMYKSLLEEKKGYGYLLYADGKPHCIAFWNAARDAEFAGKAELICIHSLQDNWRRGCGKQMMDRVLSDIKSAGYSEVVLWVFRENTRARAFYEACGFSVTEREKQALGKAEVCYIKRFTDWPDYKNSIANLPNSVMKYFGVETKGDTLPLLDRYLDREYKNVIVILLDGMGINIMERNLDADGFFRSHLAGSYSSTFPPTTVAATTSILSGQMPNEHAWLGWDCYYPQIGENVTVFLNVLQETGKPAADYNVPYTYTGYENVIDRFEKAGRTAYWAMPFVPPYPDSYEKILDRIKALAAEPGRKYIYAYWNEPDSTMHMTGCFGRESVDMIRLLERQTKELCDELEDSLVVITADHGHIDTQGVCIEDYPTIAECLVRMPSIEPRALNLFVKPELRRQFEEEFNKYFGKSFVLMTKQEVIDSCLFGTGREHACFRDMLGDYLAVAIGDTTIFNTRGELGKFIGVHAGLTKDELTIPLIVYAKDLT